MAPSSPCDVDSVGGPLQQVPADHPAGTTRSPAHRPAVPCPGTRPPGHSGTPVSGGSWGSAPPPSVESAGSHVGDGDARQRIAGRQGPGGPVDQ
ncbi:hypothetical protein SDC9_77839 [bioreactor metagenome]|uniref:Uncharacterized protein n=1 Tax=bioreactor metagenome TaxID=1076179 RepID=A0A644YZ99_9ZZZZ